MEKFALLYTGGDIPDDLVEENNVAWGDWLESLKENGVLIDGGAPFGSEDKVVYSVDKVRDFDWGKDSGVSGYTIIQAENMDVALDLAMSCPQLPEKYGSGGVEVHQLSDMM